MTTPTQVYVVTSGDYSDYAINSVWLTLEEAQAEAGDYGDVEVWPIGHNERTIGSFYRNADFDAVTGAVLGKESSDEHSSYPSERRVSILHWPGTNKVGIRVTQDTRERCDKVYSEVRARMLADISTGVPPEVFATEIYSNGAWRPKVAPTS
jgi:hypothetical protein